MSFLLVIPSIDIKDGKTVRVVQGIPELGCCQYGDDPVEMARLWRAENAKMLHVVDFDAAFDNEQNNRAIIKKICSSIVIPVEYTGGIRSLDDAEKFFDMGVCRLALATLPFQNSHEFDKVIGKFGSSKIVVCLDVIENEVVIRGRKGKTGKNPVQWAMELKERGVQRFVVTDVSRNGMLLGPNIPLSIEIASACKCRITLSGGIRNKDELMDVQKVSSCGIDSVIVGRALYENRFPCQKLWRVAESGIFN